MVNLSITARYLAGLHAYSDDYIKSEGCVIVTHLYEESFSGRMPSFPPAYNFDSMSPGKNCEAVDWDQDCLLLSLEIVCSIRGIYPCLHSSLAPIA